MTGAVRSIDFERHSASGERDRVARPVAVETPIAIEFNGIGYAVVMATPADLEDFALGFSLSERLVETTEDVVAVDRHATPTGEILRITLAPARIATVVERVRHRVSESSCGLCGIENLEQAIRPLPAAASGCRASRADLFRAIDSLGEFQPLSRATGAVHAAALCAADGSIRLVREDVGRHTAFDKLIGAMLRGGLSWDGGFALLTSRCSFELVEKAVLARCPLLATISAGTSLAIDRAREAGLALVVLARSDAILVAMPGGLA